MTSRWLWLLGALLGAGLLRPTLPEPEKRPPAHARELRRSPTIRPH